MALIYNIRKRNYLQVYAAYIGVLYVWWDQNEHFVKSYIK